MDFRIEKDSMGDIKVASDKLWGAQTQRALENFSLGSELIPIELIRAYGYLKRSCALSNLHFGKLSKEKCDLIVKVCDEIAKGRLNEHFPLHVWQTGSGTQTNMNLNEVIVNRAFQLDNSIKLNSNDDVNMSQSSNDTFPTAMKIAVLLNINELLDSLDILINSLLKKQNEFMGVLKTGRTHLQDAASLYFSDEISGYVSMMEHNKEQITDTLKYLKELPIGGTAVGTGLNSPKGFDKIVSDELNKIFSLGFTPLQNKFYGLTSHDSEVFLSGALNATASNLMKIANDIRWLASGPNCSIGEIKLPANEPGSSIMPGKVNPTQSEALTMISIQVMGNHTSISFAASQGNFELNVFKPLIIYNLLQSINILKDGMRSFALRCLEGIELNLSNIKEYQNKSLMNVTALNPYIGYENSAKIVKYAYKNNKTLKQSAVELKILTKEDFDKYMEALLKYN
ncbi:MAG: class II fumarate hydratase [Campylobacterota bacterium]|nr:class II fumarate hydratase [Campylobacterota bacterium]